MSLDAPIYRSGIHNNNREENIFNNNEIEINYKLTLRKIPVKMSPESVVPIQFHP